MHFPHAPDHSQHAPDGSDAAVRAALVDSRQRWRALTELASDLAFETDADGRFTFIWPEDALGWPAHALAGQPADRLLATLHEGFNPFTAVRHVRDRTAWLHLPGGGTRLLRFSVAPLPGGQGGVRGVAVDVTVHAVDEREAGPADIGSHHTREAMDDVIACLREELLVPRMIGTVLRAAVGVMGADGAAVVLTTMAAHALRHETAPVPPEALLLARQPLTGGTRAMSGHGMTVLACPVPDRLGLAPVLMFWRRGHGAGQETSQGDWPADHQALAESLTDAVRAGLEHDHLMLEMSRHDRTDSLTGLLNRRAFQEEMQRRVNRIHEQAAHAVVAPPSCPAFKGAPEPGVGGVLLVLDLDGFKQVNDRHGHEAGDAVLMAVAALLRHTFRPADLLARVGGDQFAVWLDGADGLTVAERADDLQGTLPQLVGSELPPGAAAIGVSIGIAPADLAGADLDDLLRRATEAMHTAKANGGGWQVAHPESSA